MSEEKNKKEDVSWVSQLTPAEAWIAYLSPNVSEEARAELPKYFPIFKEVLQAEKEFRENPELMAQYEAREKELQAMQEEYEKAQKKDT